MGGRKAGFNTNRSEFMHENALDGDIEYQRTGGCFVTTKKAIVLAIIAILALIAVGAVIYLYRTQSKPSEEDGSLDIEKLLNESLNTNKQEDFRLPSYIQPLHYRLRIHPYLDEPNSNNFTFTGRVTITLQCTKLTKKIVLNSEDLEIISDKVKIATTKDLRLRSLSQVVDPQTATNSTFNTMSQPSVNQESPTVPQIEVNRMPELQPNQQEIMSPIQNTSNAEPVLPPNPVPSVNLTPPSNPALPSNPLPPSNQESPSNPILPPNPVQSPDSVPTVAGLPTSPQPTPLTSMTSEISASQPIPNTSNNTNPLISGNNLPIPNVVNTNNDSNFSNSNTDSVVVSPNPSPDIPQSPPTEYTSSPDSVYKTAKLINVDIKKQEEDKEMSTYVIHLVSALQPGVNYTLDIEFSGKILNNLVGLYKTSYTDSEGRKRWLATTQFQPTFARRAFPCFDEPSFRSSFEISIGRRTNMITLSNMALKESEPMVNHTGWVWDHFEISPTMSPHLVAFTVCDFDSVKPPSLDAGPVFKIWAPKQSLINAQYAIEIAPKVLSYMQNYFGVKYPLSKIDLVAVPELSRTATESWGLISFRDTALLLDSNSDSWKTKNHIFKTIARKLTTQWFGNLVTMEWWSELWLIEGFSTYMEDVVENAIEPDLEDLDIFALRIMQAILDSDKLKSVRSLHMDIKDPTQIEQLFNDVSSNKGSCLIRMLNYTVTEGLFKEGIQSYLKKWMLKCSNQDNFWDSISNVISNKNVFPPDLTVKTFMDSWIKQEGYPVVTVTRDYTTGSALINQTRFVRGNSTYNSVWYIPLTYTKQNDNGAVTTMWLKQEESISTVNFTQPGNSTWVIFNVEQAGFYRVNYDITNWKLLRNQLLEDPRKILPSNRGQILNDAFELANAGILDYTIPLELTKYLVSKERNYIPWFSFFNSLQALIQVIGRTQYNGIFQRYIISIIKPLYDELGTSEKPGETQNDKLLRSFTIKMACNNNYEPCLEWAKQKYQEWMTSPEPDKINPIPFEFQETVQCSAIKTGGQKEWEFLWQRTLHSSISPVNLKLAYLTLGCTREPWLINSYLEKSLDGSIAIQNIQYIWKSIAHPVGLSVGFAFLRTNWERIYNNYQRIFSNIKSIFEDFLSKLSTETDLEDLTIFYKNYKEKLHPVSSLILSVVDRLKWRIYWTQSHVETIVTWLLQNITK